ncbi:hypothetical protein FV113G1_P10780 (plasmid) [Fusobacterium varium]|nr:hypothetical protein FV113G1_P10780 [Fusobacterium varium]
MNFNSFILLRILIQGKYTDDELLKYLSINLYSLQRNMKSLNDFLASLKMPQIQKVDNYFYLKITKDEKDRLFKNLNIHFSPYREEYLFFKVLIKGFINLEAEAKFLNVSRSTIVRDFANVRSILEDHHIKTKYRSGKGIFIESEIQEIHNSFSLKIMKIILEITYIPTNLFEFIPELTLENIKIEYQKLYKISEKLNTRMGEFVFSSIYSLIILGKYFKNTYILLLEKRLKKIKDKKEFVILKKYLAENLNTEENILNYITFILYDIKYDRYNFSYFIPYHNKFLSKLKKELKIDIEIPYKIKNAFLTKLFASLIRASNKIIYVSTLHPNADDKIIINIIEKILLDLNVKYYYGDILQLLQITKTLLVENILAKKITILFLIQEYLTLNIDEILNKIKNISPNIDYEVRSTIYYEYSEKKISDYDLIISDQLNTSGIHRMKILNSCELENIIHNFCIKKSIKKLKN